MRITRAAALFIALFWLIVPALLAEVDDPYGLRVFDRGKSDASYVDQPFLTWDKNAPSPVNVYYGWLPNAPGSPFSTMELMMAGVPGGFVPPQYGDTTRKGYQTPMPVPNDGQIVYYLLGGAGSPMSCGYSGEVGEADTNGDGSGESRPGMFIDDCEQIGRNAQSVGSCAEEFVESELDQNGNLHNLENPAGGAQGYRCKVILLTLSAMWCGPCQAQADTAQAFFEEYRDPDGDGFDEFMAIEVLIEDEFGNPADVSDTMRWANTTFIPWSSGALGFPVLADGNASVWVPYNYSSSLPTNVVIGADFVIDYRRAGWDEATVRSVIEENLCQIVPSGTTVGATTCP